MGIYTGSDLVGLPDTPGAYALVNYNPRAHQKNTSVIYIGHAGGMSIKARVKTHLVELTGTWTNGKHPASIDLDLVDRVYSWSSDGLRDFAPGISDKIIAEAIELVAKQHDDLTPVMITDSKSPTHAALELSNKPLFSSAAKAYISNNKVEIKLPSRANLTEQIKALELNQQIIKSQIKDLMEKLDNA